MKRSVKAAAALLAALAVTGTFCVGAKADTYRMDNGVLTHFSDSGENLGVVSGWVTKGADRYYYKNGKMMKASWLMSDGKPTYYLRNDGRMAQGKLRINGKLYVFGKNGRLQDENAESFVGMANPFTDCSDMEKAYDIAGFYASVPEKIKGFGNRDSITAVADYMIQVTYSGKNGGKITVRKGSTRDDISGDYNKYRFSQTEDLKDGRKLTYKGSDESSISLVTWVYKGYSFSVSTDVPLSMEDMGKIAAAVK